MRGTSAALHYRRQVAHNISIHVPLAGNVFIQWKRYYYTTYFYPRSPCGERQAAETEMKRVLDISIHVPLAGNVSVDFALHSPHRVLFLSTFPLRGTSSAIVRVSPLYVRISIHVPLAGNVPAVNSGFKPKRNFYPRSPCGERPDKFRVVVVGIVFLSTFPLRGTSAMCSQSALTNCIFLSTFPLRGTSALQSQQGAVLHISIHVPLAGNVAQRRRQANYQSPFLSTFPLRGTSSLRLLYVKCQRNFYPRSPCGERQRQYPSQSAPS